ncbi:iron-containing alcohol dehydrogenase [Chitinibacter tainanensis]|uniref:iron-containing alcohol dehydrogenase n=1 Tax=Chitinibacter tainanensis TaxID=230667 RepID=UPI00235210C1|nr:iron-containing alcohol dehydrogenase [Chitinibacter tainanensis]
MFYSFNPIKLIHGEGALARIGYELPSSGNVLVIHGLTFSSYEDAFLSAIKTAHQDLRLSFLQLDEGEPTFSSVEHAAQTIDSRPDFILGFGGGRILDATKALAVCIGNQLSVEQLPSIPPSQWQQTIPFGLICTKPGSGSEGNNAFVLMEQDSFKKLSFFSIHSYPRFAVHDPILFSSLSSHDYRAGIADVVSHIIDQYLVKRTPSLIQDSMSLNYLRIAAELSLHAVAPSHQNFSDLAWLGSLSSSGILSRGVKTSWLVHEVAHALASLNGTSHAISIATVMGVVLSFDRHPLDRLVMVARCLNVRPEQENLSREQAVSAITEFYRNLELVNEPSCNLIPQLAELKNQLQEYCPNLNPEEVNVLCKFLLK